MSFATRKMTDADLDAQPELAKPYKTATPQILPPMLRLQTSANASPSRVIQSNILSPAAVEITISRSNVVNNQLSAIGPGTPLFQTSFQNRPTVSAPLEQQLDYQHDAFSTVPDLKQRLSNLDKEIRVGEEAPNDSIKAVVAMHNNILQKNDASIEKLRSKHRKTKELFDELAESHFATSANTKTYLEMAQTMMESHSSALEQQQKQLDMMLKTKNRKTNDSTFESFESQNEAIRALQEQTQAQMQEIEELHELLESNAGREVNSTNSNTQEYLKMSQGILEGHNSAIADLQDKMKQTMNLSAQVAEHKRHIAELRDTHDELRETVQLHEDEFDALHELRA